MTDQEMKELKLVAFALINSVFKEESKTVLENMKVIINGIFQMEKNRGYTDEIENIVSCVYRSFEEFAISLKYEPIEFNKKEL